MGGIDAHFQREGVPIHARQIQALSEVSKRFKICVIGGPLRTGPVPGVYEGESLSAHILHWFDQRYGERLKVDFSIGYSVVVLRGEAWLVRFPLMYGAVTVICDRDLQKSYNSFVVSKGGEPQQKAMLNLLQLIEKLPQGLANLFTDDELRELLNYFIFANKTFSTIRDSCSGNELAAGSVADLETSARFAVGNFHGYGQSLWASLQTAEKILKFFIASKGEKFPQIHDLTKLALQAYGLGLSQIDAALIERVQCKAGVRYEQRKYPIQKVVDAHQGALQIVYIVTESLFPETCTVEASDETEDQQEPNSEAPTSFDTILQPGHFYFSQKLGFSYYCLDIVDDLVTMIMVESYQHGRLIQVVYQQKVEYQNHYIEITNVSEIDRLKQVGEKILHDHGVI